MEFLGVSVALMVFSGFFFVLLTVVANGRWGGDVGMCVCLYE